MSIFATTKNAITRAMKKAAAARAKIPAPTGVKMLITKQINIKPHPFIKNVASSFLIVILKTVNCFVVSRNYLIVITNLPMMTSF